MTEPLTDAELEILEALATRATPGPWFFQPKMQLDADGCMTVPTNLGWVSTDPKADYLTVVSSAWDGDALYIAAVSPGVAQRLIETIRADRREIARLREGWESVLENIERTRTWRSTTGMRVASDTTPFARVPPSGLNELEWLARAALAGTEATR